MLPKSHAAIPAGQPPSQQANVTDKLDTYTALSIVQFALTCIICQRKAFLIMAVQQQLNMHDKYRRVMDQQVHVCGSQQNAHNMFSQSVQSYTTMGNKLLHTA